MQALSIAGVVGVNVNAGIGTAERSDAETAVKASDGGAGL